MKNLKRLAGLLLALILALGMMAPALAEDEKGSITIDNVVLKNGKPEATYTVYKMLELTSYKAGTPATDGNPATQGQYSYKALDEWKDFIINGAGKDYMAINTNGYVEWKAGVGTDKATAGVFAQAALAYAKEKNIPAVVNSATAGNEAMTVTEPDQIKFINLDLGYYLLDSSIGVLCALTTTNPDAQIEAKNKAPTIEKGVKVGTAYESENSATIGDVVEFRTIINVHKGSQNFVLHDEMSAGLTFDPNSVKIEHLKYGASQTHEASKDTHYTVKTQEENGVPLADGCDFEIHFKDPFMNDLDNNDKVYVYYTATLNDNAVVKTDTETNTNTTQLDYGENHHTTESKTTTDTYAFDIAKVDVEGDLLDGAEFMLYKKTITTEEDGTTTETYTVIPVVENNTTANGSKVYRVQQTAEENADNVIKAEGGRVRIEGLGEGTYYLQETKAPAGYNQLAGYTRVDVNGNNYVTYKTTGESGNTVYAYEKGGIKVVNNAGSILPDTGGIGTTLFYAIGGVLVAAAVVLLVTRKRMAEK